MKVSFFKDCGQHHQEQAKFHKACASCYRGLIGKADAPSYFADLAAAHEAAAESHLRMCKSYEIEISELDEQDDSSIQDNSGAGEDLLNAALGEERFIKLVPDKVRATVTTMTGPRTQSVQLVPRYGSPEVQTPKQPTLDGVDFLNLKDLEP